MFWPKHMALRSLPLQGFVDASHATKALEYAATYGYVFYMFGALIYIKSKRITIQTVSVNEAEYFGAAECAREAIHLRRLVEALGYIWEGPVIIGEDNSQVIRQVSDPEVRLKLKQLPIRCHIVKDYVKHGMVKLVYCRTHLNVGDSTTKCTDGKKFKELTRLLKQGGGSSESRLALSTVFERSLVSAFTRGHWTRLESD